MSKLASRSLWAIILIPILAVSAYSLYVVARHFGVPPLIAIAMSTCFDGVALLCANYSIRYASLGLSGSVPHAAVWLFALTGAYVQTFHARIGTGELTGSWVLWASLPIAAVVVYEVHIRWAKREALIAHGATYTTPRPVFGALTWVLYPRGSFRALRDVIAIRLDAITKHALSRPQIIMAVEDVREPKRAKRSEPKRELESPKRGDAAAANRSGDKRAPVIHVRAWAKAHGYDVKDRARLPQDVHAAYAREHAEEHLAPGECP
jgi:hypothetical protein